MREGLRILGYILGAFIVLGIFLVTVALIIESIWPSPPYVSPEEYRRQRDEAVEHSLPGCEFKTFHRYKDIDRLVVVICDGRKTTSTNYEFRLGKRIHRHATIGVE